MSLEVDPHGDPWAASRWRIKLELAQLVPKPRGGIDVFCRVVRLCLGQPIGLRARAGERPHGSAVCAAAGRQHESSGMDPGARWRLSPGDAATIGWRAGQRPEKRPAVWL